MLFSQTDLAQYLDTYFECSWESVAPVPRVTVSFGDGHVLERTLHGNIATWLCTPDGEVFEVIPGLVDAEAYRLRLNEALVAYAQLTAAPDRASAVVEHNLRRAERLEQLRAADEQARLLATVLPTTPGFDSKMAIETPVESALGLVVTPTPLRPPVPALLVGDEPAALADPELALSKDAIELPLEQALGVAEPANEGLDQLLAAAPTRMDLFPELALSKRRIELPLEGALGLHASLYEDTRRNLLYRDPVAARMIAAQPLAAPQAYTRALYREVLEVDLDDPYLGLAPLVLGAELGRLAPESEPASE